MSAPLPDSLVVVYLGRAVGIRRPPSFAQLKQRVCDIFNLHDKVNNSNNDDSDELDELSDDDDDEYHDEHVDDSKSSGKSSKHVSLKFYYYTQPALEREEHGHSKTQISTTRADSEELAEPEKNNASPASHRGFSSDETFERKRKRERNTSLASHLTVHKPFGNARELDESLFECLPDDYELHVELVASSTANQDQIREDQQESVKDLNDEDCGDVIHQPPCKRARSNSSSVDVVVHVGGPTEHSNDPEPQHGPMFREDTRDPSPLLGRRLSDYSQGIASKYSGNPSPAVVDGTDLDDSDKENETQNSGDEDMREKQRISKSAQSTSERGLLDADENCYRCHICLWEVYAGKCVDCGQEYAIAPPLEDCEYKPCPECSCVVERSTIWTNGFECMNEACGWRCEETGSENYSVSSEATTEAECLGGEDCAQSECEKEHPEDLPAFIDDSDHADNEEDGASTVSLLSSHDPASPTDLDKPDASVSPSPFSFRNGIGSGGEPYAGQSLPSHISHTFLQPVKKEETDEEAILGSLGSGSVVNGRKSRIEDDEEEDSDVNGHIGSDRSDASCYILSPRLAISAQQANLAQ